MRIRRRKVARPRVRVHGYSAFSNAAKRLARELGVLRIKDPTNFVGRPQDIILNCGSSTLRCRVHPDTRILNRPEAVALAVNKIRTFEVLTENEIPTLPWTKNRQEAFQWYTSGETVYARTKLTAHSGAGIVVVDSGTSYYLSLSDGTTGADLQSASDGTLFPRASLFTKAITGGRREYRYHVFGEEVILVQKKKRRDGWQENPNYSNDVRNHSTGWIYSIHDAQQDDRVAAICINAVKALGLEYGAVDIITRRDAVYVVEVNSCCGIQSETVLEKYSDAIRGWLVEQMG